ncbi:MAG: CYTH domain-containing protein [Gammaproteobacteria bacterium]
MAFREIERKFLVTDTSVIADSAGTSMVQAYLISTAERSLRVRMTDEGSFLTFKGPRAGAARVEIECEVPTEMAEQLLHICEPAVVSKIRYPVFANGWVWAVDVFQDDNEGLVLAEVELPRENSAVTKPHWCGLEVTEDERYYNEFLARTPYRTWK